jgi:hypothetical protein
VLTLLRVLESLALHAGAATCRDVRRVMGCLQQMSDRAVSMPAGGRADRAIPAAYWAPVATFLSASTETILGHLVQASEGAVDLDQRNAWTQEIEILKDAVGRRAGTIFLEFSVPRLASRIDAVLVDGSAVFPIEFKCVTGEHARAGLDQVWDYALDLKNFHEGSHEAPILPVLVTTGAQHSDVTWPPPHSDGVRPPIRCNARTLGQVLEHGLSLVGGCPLDPVAWGRSRYEPTPTIIEAARALYGRHSVDAISRHDAGAVNLSVTSRTLERIIEDSGRRRGKAIVFVTGVPGAGKTLVGLNVATQRRRPDDPTHAVYLSGNGPLVAVLREALTRDDLERRKRTDPRARKGAVAQEVKQFIQNVHHFRDEGVRNRIDAPFDHVVIFDEAQRAWDSRKTADFMRRRKKVANFDQSEPEFLLSYMDRREDWAVVICLVGGGQEIHNGEGGISAWLDAVRGKFPHWLAYISPELADSEYAAGSALEKLEGHGRVETDSGLHLAVSLRSFRTERLSSFVKCLLDREIGPARDTLARLRDRYPIALTRDLQQAKSWIRARARGSERCGLLASSNAYRLKPHAIDVRVDVDPVQWFLSPPTDTRSSNYLEDAATEFQIQGLEVDWSCVTWDADLRYSTEGWRHHSFRGDGWNSVRRPELQQYLVNAYRVLLTRARQGMVLFIPPGDTNDPTRPPDVYDRTCDYLAELGIEQV